MQNCLTANQLFRGNTFSKAAIPKAPRTLMRYAQFRLLFYISLLLKNDFVNDKMSTERKGQDLKTRQVLQGVTSCPGWNVQ